MRYFCAFFREREASTQRPGSSATGGAARDACPTFASRLHSSSHSPAAKIKGVTGMANFTSYSSRIGQSNLFAVDCE